MSDRAFVANGFDENWNRMQPVGFDPTPDHDCMLRIDDTRVVRLGQTIHNAINASGYVIVPREPTEAMVKALLVNGPTADTVRMHREAIVRDWKIMVDAAMP